RRVRRLPLRDGRRRRAGAGPRGRGLGAEAGARARRRAAGLARAPTGPAPSIDRAVGLPRERPPCVRRSTYYFTRLHSPRVEPSGRRVEANRRASVELASAFARSADIRRASHAESRGGWAFADPPIRASAAA